MHPLDTKPFGRPSTGRRVARETEFLFGEEFSTLVKRVPRSVYLTIFDDILPI
jgi:hypothetical protein